MKTTIYFTSGWVASGKLDEDLVILELEGEHRESEVTITFDADRFEQFVKTVHSLFGQWKLREKEEYGAGVKWRSNK